MHLCNIIQPIKNFLTIQLIPGKGMHAFIMLYQKQYIMEPKKIEKGEMESMTLWNSVDIR